jgi:hypothetical protein
VQRTSITLKLALTLAVPIVVLAFATTLGVRSASDERDAVRRQTELAGAAIGPSGLLTALQNERVWVLTDVFGFQDVSNTPVSSYDEAYSATDGARADMAERLGVSDVAATAFGEPMAALDDLDAVRSEVEAFMQTTADLPTRVEFAFGIWSRYNAMVEPFYDASTKIVGEIEDAELRQGARMSDNVARGLEFFNRAASRAVAIAILTENGVDTREEVAELSRLEASLERYRDAIASPEGDYARIAAIPDAVEQLEAVDAVVQDALDTGRMDMADLLEGMPQGEGLYVLQDEVHGIIGARADFLEERAETRQLRLVTLAIGGLLFVILLNLVVSRSVTRPLRSLTGQAKEVAQRRLPSAVQQLLEAPVGDQGVTAPEIEPVVVDGGGGDELAGVAGALNTVQTSVVDLAAQQAVYRRNISDLFVSLNGRNQDLLRRQIGLIGELNTELTSPAARASFSQLDHLATQMRRNTESMLAVAGVDARRVWQAPVEVGEVVGYALGSLPDTRRLVVHDLEPAAVAGAVANDIVHLLSELIENALEMGVGDDRPVEVRGGPKHETGGYWLAVVDFGAVLTPNEVQVANRQLASNGALPSPVPSASLSLPPASNGSSPVAGGAAGGGSPVSAHLAKRAGVSVRLDSSAGWGVTVTVDIPPDLLVRRPSVAPGPDLGAPAPATWAPPLTTAPMAPPPPHTLSTP